ncbi:ATP-dependent DNA helicase RecQ [Cellulomonas fimi]|nr:ATP-dependent DNA helicase RecQ [Cellulomonas fimi]
MRGVALDDAVAQVLGPDATLREAQRDALAGLADHDTLLVARTGAGKSAVYAIATLVARRLTLVVSPLVALQRDQAQSLREVGLRAATVSSAVSTARQKQALDDAAARRLDVLLLAPEQLQRTVVLDALRVADVGLVVVDEAHCVSEWGHDFRPDYLHVGSAVRALGRPRVLAMTATASAHARDEVVERLGLDRPRVLVHDADRPNIWLGAHPTATEGDQDARVVEEVLATEGAAIVYARTRARTEEVAALLDRGGRPALVYHAGLPAKERARVQDAFLHGRHDTVVATSAFGMGVDRADVRLVVHVGPPPSLDAYYQEVGRAGRDGEPARAVVVHRPADTALNRYLRSGGGPRPATLQTVLVSLADGPLDRAALVDRSGLGARTVARALAELQQVGAVRDDDGRWAGTDEVTGREALAAVRAARERRAALDESRVELVRTYTDTTDCRRRLLLELLGEHHPDPCGRCDSCDRGTSTPVQDAAARPGQPVRHEQFGDGTVSVVEADRLTVLFDEHGYVTLDAAVALDSALLTPR